VTDDELLSEIRGGVIRGQVTVQRGLHSQLMDTIRLLVFTTLWTAIWAAPLPKLSRRVELVAGLIPFAAFGLRVFGACFIGVPADDPVRMVVAPLVDWINGASGPVPFQWVLDVTVAIGLVWFASIANISRRWRLVTIWVMPAVALATGRS
jgi:hypothetical protein